MYGSTDDLDYRSSGEGFYGARVSPPFELLWSTVLPRAESDAELVFGHAGVVITGKGDSLWHIRNDGSVVEISKPRGEVGSLETLGDRFLCFYLDGPRLWDLEANRQLFYGESLVGPIGVCDYAGSKVLAYRTHLLDLGSLSLTRLPFEAGSGNVSSSLFVGSASVKGESVVGAVELGSGKILWRTDEIVYGLHWTDNTTGIVRFRDRVEHVDLATGKRVRGIPIEWRNSRVKHPFVFARNKVYSFETRELILALEQNPEMASIAGDLFWYVERTKEKPHRNSLHCYSLEDSQTVWSLELPAAKPKQGVYYGMTHAGLFRVDKKTVELYGPPA